jgi:hypothetical protein
LIGDPFAVVLLGIVAVVLLGIVAVVLLGIVAVVLLGIAFGVTGLRPGAQEQVLGLFPEGQPAEASAVVDLGAGLRSSRRR